MVCHGMSGFFQHPNPQSKLSIPWFMSQFRTFLALKPSCVLQPGTLHSPWPLQPASWRGIQRWFKICQWAVFPTGMNLVKMSVRIIKTWASIFFPKQSVLPASYWSKRIYVMFQLREVRSHHSAILVVHLSIQSLHDIGQSCLQLWVQRDQEGVCNLTLADLPSKLINPNGHKARLRLAWNKYSSSNTCQLECRHKRPRALAKFRDSAPFFQCLFEQKEQKSIITLSNVKFLSKKTLPASIRLWSRTTKKQKRHENTTCLAPKASATRFMSYLFFRDSADTR